MQTKLVLGLSVATLVASTTTMVSHSFGRATYGLLLPAIEDDLALSHTRAGIGGTVIYAAYLIGVVTVALVAPRFEPIAIMRAGLGLAVVGLLTLSAAPSLLALLAGIGIAAGAGAGIWITAPAISTIGVAPTRRGLVIGLLSATIGISTFVVGMSTNAARSLVGDEGLWRPIYAAEAVVTVLILVALVTVVRPDRTEKVEGGFSLGAMRAIPAWARVTAAYSTFGAVGAGVSSFLVVALEQDAGFGREAATSLFASMGLIGIVTAPLIGSLSDRLGRRALMTTIMALISVGVATVALVTGPAVALGVLTFGSLWSSFPVLTASYVRDHVEARAFGTAFATMTIFYSFAAVASPYSVGWLADRTGSFRVPYLLLSALALLGLFLAWGLPRGSVRGETGPTVAVASEHG